MSDTEWILKDVRRYKEQAKMGLDRLVNLVKELERTIVCLRELNAELMAENMKLKGER